MTGLKTYTTILLTFAVTVLYSASLSDSYKIDNLKPHPRLIMASDEIKTILKNVERDKNWQKIHNAIIEECNSLKDREVCGRTMEGRRLLHTSREALRRIFYLSYAYRTTNDRSYAERAQKEMVAIANFTDWNPSHFLDVAEMTLAMAIGYDWCYNTLSETTRKTLEDAIVQMGVNLSLDKKNNQWLTADNNWNQVCNASMVYGALAVAENYPELAAQMTKRAIETIPLSMAAYGPDGAYPEGIGYWEYGTSFNVLLIDALTKNYNTDFGLRKTAGFMESAVYSQNMITPAGFPYSYADVGTQIGFSSTVFWFYAQTKNPELLFMQKLLFERDKNRKILKDRLLPMSLIFGAGSGAQLENPQQPDSKMWYGGGAAPVAVMRSAWAGDDAIMVGFKAGTPSSNHGHMDVGSFFIEASGIRWAHDLGMQSYEIAERVGVDLWNGSQNSQRWDVFRLNNMAHNVMIVNDKRQDVDGVAAIDKLTRDEDFMSVVSDITKVMPYSVKSVKRGVALVDKKYVVVEDVIQTGKFYTRAKWNMMTPASKITQIDPNTILLENSGRRAYVRIETDAKMEFFNNAATVKNSFDSENKGISSIGWQGELPLNTETTIRVYIMPDEMIDNRTKRPIVN